MCSWPQRSPLWPASVCEEEDPGVCGFTRSLLGFSLSRILPVCSFPFISVAKGLQAWQRGKRAVPLGVPAARGTPNLEDPGWGDDPRGQPR